ncbi:MAG: hypothetical protein P8177_05015 [Gemmatimonadota bacterium]
MAAEAEVDHDQVTAVGRRIDPVGIHGSDERAVRRHLKITAQRDHLHGRRIGHLTPRTQGDPIEKRLEGVGEVRGSPGHHHVVHERDFGIAE